jgi:biotin/methionine sulfoxide reductase
VRYGTGPESSEPPCDADGSTTARSHPAARGADEFAAVSSEELTELLATELQRFVDTHGNEASYGGSYGWASAGRFHHAQSQVHRFLKLLGG